MKLISALNIGTCSHERLKATAQHQNERYVNFFSQTTSINLVAKTWWCRTTSNPAISNQIKTKTLTQTN